MKTVILPNAQIHMGSLIVVNARYPYHERGNRLVLRPVQPENNRVFLDAHAVAQLSPLMEELNAWKQMTAVSGWRSRQEQQELYESSCKTNGPLYTQKFVALPGHSEHQTGLAIDLALTQEHIDFICPSFPYTGICQAFRRQAVSYGFVERYPRGKEHITGIAHEPWHFRCVGTPHAEIMDRHGLVLEEYIDFLKGYPYGTTPCAAQAGGQNFAISYLKAHPASDTRFEIDDRIPYTVSGNNIDGYIITQGRARHGES